MTDTIEIARDAFGEITSTFPHLEWRVREDEPVELSIDIPKQDGLDFAINLNFQNGDELHFSVSHFWCEWFPCTDPAKVQEFKKAVIGFIAGDYRLLEHYRRQRAVKAELQAPEKGSWVTVATRSTLSWPFSRKMSYRIVQNVKRVG